MSIKLNSVGGGSVTIQEPNTASDFTLSVPAATADLLTSSSDLTTQVKSATNASGSAPVYSCRAWVNFNGTGTVAIRASGNVSSITDVLTGQYVINFTTAMPNANYSACLTCLTGNTTNPSVASIGTVGGMTTSSISIGTFEGANSAQDYAVVCAAIFR